MKKMEEERRAKENWERNKFKVEFDGIVKMKNLCFVVQTFRLNAESLFGDIFNDVGL